MQGQHSLCEEFCGLLETYVRGDMSAARKGRLYVLASRLWTCANMMPILYRLGMEELVRWLDMPAWKRSGTYAAAARHMRASIEKDAIIYPGAGR